MGREGEGCSGPDTHHSTGRDRSKEREGGRAGDGSGTEDGCMNGRTKEGKKEQSAVYRFQPGVGSDGIRLDLSEPLRRRRQLFRSVMLAHPLRLGDANRICRTLKPAADAAPKSRARRNVLRAAGGASPDPCKLRVSQVLKKCLAELARIYLLDCPRPQTRAKQLEGRSMKNSSITRHPFL